MEGGGQGLTEYTKKVFLNKEARKPGATEQIKEEAKQTIRMYSHMLKVQKESNLSSLKKAHNKSYKKLFLEDSKGRNKLYIQ